MDIQEICGNEQAKRAMEIALVGNHPIEFIGMDEAKDCLRAYYHAYEILHNEMCMNASVVFPCLCGNFSDPVKACLCEPEKVKEHWMTNKLTKPAITVYTMRPNAETIVKHLSGKKN